jgi:hypothetical protein
MWVRTFCQQGDDPDVRAKTRVSSVDGSDLRKCPPIDWLSVLLVVVVNNTCSENSTCVVNSTRFVNSTCSVNQHLLREPTLAPSTTHSVNNTRSVCPERGALEGRSAYGSTNNNKAKPKHQTETKTCVHGQNVVVREYIPLTNKKQSCWFIYFLHVLDKSSERPGAIKHVRKTPRREKNMEYPSHRNDAPQKNFPADSLSLSSLDDICPFRMRDGIIIVVVIIINIVVVIINIVVVIVVVGPGAMNNVPNSSRRRSRRLGNVVVVVAGTVLNDAAAAESAAGFFSSYYYDKR